jgi:glycosyltransferase involved in cell wall biosynthesis
VSTMPLGVLMPDDAPPIANREPLILSVGTLYGYKDTMVTLRAFGRARSRLPDGARLVIAGKDFRGQIEVLRRATVEMGIESVVEIRGPVTSGELEDLYRRASMLIMPSRCEGFGLPVAEAMSRNTPVVVANATSLPEVAGAAGLVIETGDIASFANAMIEVLGDSALRSAMSKRGRIRAQELNWEASAQVLYQSIQKVLPS